MEESALMIQVAEAVVFLAKAGLLCTDLRPENFMVSTEAGSTRKVVVIDYDDMEIAQKKAKTFADFEEQFGLLSGTPEENNYIKADNGIFQTFRECLQQTKFDS